MTDMVARLDEYGKGAWIGVMVLSFVLFWPVGLAILAFLLWSGRMGCGHNADKSRWKSRFADGFEKARDRVEREMRGFGGPSSGNNAFDEYRRDTLRRLEEEEREFRSFLDRLRHAKDKSEFDQFMADRRNSPSGPAQSSSRT